MGGRVVFRGVVPLGPRLHCPQNFKRPVKLNLNCGRERQFSGVETVGGRGRGGNANQGAPFTKKGGVVIGKMGKSSASFNDKASQAQTFRPDTRTGLKNCFPLALSALTGTKERSYSPLNLIHAYFVPLNFAVEGVPGCPQATDDGHPKLISAILTSSKAPLGPSDSRKGQQRKKFDDPELINRFTGE
jgi:hypothetical protein